MVIAEDSKRMAEIREAAWRDNDWHPNSLHIDDVRWLLDQLAARDARIAKLEAALKYIAWAGPELSKGKLVDIAQDALK